MHLQKYLNQLAAAFRRGSTRPNLPQSIRGLWKADLFLGAKEPDQWVGTTVKYNPRALEAAAGLRVAIVPTQAGRNDKIRRDEQKNLIVCPIPHDANYMQLFHESWRMVQTLCATDFQMPKDIDLPSPIYREAARVFIERRNYPIGEVLEATEKFGQPHLLDSNAKSVSSGGVGEGTAPATRTVVGPMPLIGED